MLNQKKLDTMILEPFSQSGDKYCKLPDGTLIQWGSAGAYASSNRANVTVTFPTSFIGNYYMVANGSYFSDANAYEGVICTVRGIDTTKAEVHQRNAIANYVNVFSWVAIGRWK